MKKNLFFVGIAAAAMLASCSNDETMDIARNSQAIQFSSFVNKTTRATDIGKSSVSCPLKPSDSAPLKHSTMPP